MLADVRSYSNKPPELYLLTNRPYLTGKPIPDKPVTGSPIPEFFTNDWIDPRIVNFKARDGATVYGRLYVPSNYKGGGPAVLFVHGAGYLQNVHRWWSSYYREYMFNHLLMERVLSCSTSITAVRPVMAAIGGPESIVTWAVRI